MTRSQLQPIRRRAIGLMLVCSLGLLPACSKKAPQERAVDSTARRYERVVAGMTKQEVVASLGEPASRRENVYRWEIKGGPESSASVELHFDSADRVTKIVRSH